MTTCRDQDFLEGADEGTSKSLEPQKTQENHGKSQQLLVEMYFHTGKTWYLTFYMCFICLYHYVPIDFLTLVAGILH